MKVVGYYHSKGKFTPKDGKNAGQEVEFDSFKIHFISESDNQDFHGQETGVISIPTKNWAELTGGAFRIEECIGNELIADYRLSGGKPRLVGLRLK